MLQQAFKEWAVICRALAAGRQAVILRKGGIAEAGGAFRLEHTRFWLFPTFTHQQRHGVRSEALPWLDEAEHRRPPAGKVHLSHWAEVTGVYRVRDLTAALLLAHLHWWSEQVVRQRFAYREPGLDGFTVRVHRAPKVEEIPDTPRYEGCKSWVELDQPLPTEGSTAVLSDQAYRDIQIQLDMLLTPTALV